MALDSSSSRTRSITAIGAGAVLFAVVGYLLLNKNRKKPKKKSKQSNNIESMQAVSMSCKSTEQQVPIEDLVTDKSLDENLSEPIEASSPFVTKEKFFSDKEIFEISIEKTTEKRIFIKDVKTEAQNQIVPEKDMSKDELSKVEATKQELKQEIKEEAKKETNKEIKREFGEEVNQQIELIKSSASSSSEISSESANLSSSSFVVSSPPNEKNIEIKPIKETLVDKPTEKPISKKQAKKQNAAEKKTETVQKTPKKSKTTQNLNKNATTKTATLTKSQTLDVVTTKNVDDSKPFEDLVVYEFNFPRKLCGKLIGKNGVHVDYIRSKTHTQIAVRNDPNVEEQQIVCVSGLLEDVDHALDIIRARFPPKHYPQISFKPISKPIIYRRYNTESSAFNGPKVLVAPNMYVDVKTVPKTNDLIDVYVSAVAGPTHVFIQLPKNNTFNNLQKLDQNMLAVYNNPEERIPLMVEPIEYGSICVAPTSYGWHRAMVTNYLSKSQILELNPDYNEPCGLATVKFLDYGGYLDIPANQLKQLRSDFMVLPFQAIECYLDGVCAYEGTEESGRQFLTDMVRSSTLKASIKECYEGLSAVKLYLYNDLYDGLEINSEIVNNNFGFNYSINGSSYATNNKLDDSHQLVPQSL